MLALSVVVVGGYLALTSSANEGTAFALPLLPPLVVLAVAALATLPWRATAVALATLLAVVAAANLLMKSGVRCSAGDRSVGARAGTRSGCGNRRPRAVAGLERRIRQAT